MGGVQTSPEMYEDLTGIWCSDDGKKWNLVTDSPQWGKRNSFTLVELNNKFLLIDVHLNDIWSSSDLKTWSRLIDKTPWKKRVLTSFSIYSNQIWMMGGYVDKENSSDCSNEVWHSSNVTDWTQANVNAEWPARYNHSSITFDNKLWVIGGCTEETNFSDVWYTEMQTGIKEPKNAVVMSNNLFNIEKTFQNDLQIHFKLEETTPVRIGIFNSIGQEIALICNDIRQFGEHTITWNTKGELISGGIYFINFKTGNKKITQKVNFR